MTSATSSIVKPDADRPITVIISDGKYASKTTSTMTPERSPSKLIFRKDSMFDEPPSPFDTASVKVVGWITHEIEIENEDQQSKEGRIDIGECDQGVQIIPSVHPAPVTFDTLPNELRVRIFKLLTVPELMRAARTCRSWRVAAYDGALWQDLDLIPYYRGISGDQMLALALAAGGFLRTANFRGCIQLSSQMLRALSEHCNNVRVLSLVGCRSVSSDSVACFLGQAHQLEVLDMAGLECVNNHTLQTVAASCNRLRSLNVSGCKCIRAAGVVAVARGCPSLTALMVNGCGEFDSTHLAALGTAAPNLQRLSLASCTLIDDSGLVALLPHTPTLKRLNLSSCPRITDDTLRALATHTPHLTHLELSGCTLLTDDGLTQLFTKVPSFRYLDLEEINLITDLTVRALGTHQENLVHLCLSGCELVTDDAVRFLARSSATLNHLELDSCVLVTDAALKAWAARGKSSTIEVYDCRHITYAGVREAQKGTGVKVRSFYSWQVGESDDEDAAFRRAPIGGRRHRGYARRRRRNAGNSCTIL